MSSDYIPRLREELLRAGAERQTSRRRPVRVPLRPLVPVAAVVLIVAAIVVAWPAGRENESAAPQTPTTKLAYRTDPARADEVAQILRTRLAHAGVDARVAVSGAAPDDHGARGRTGGRGRPDAAWQLRDLRLGDQRPRPARQAGAVRSRRHRRRERGPQPPPSRRPRRRCAASGPATPASCAPMAVRRTSGSRSAAIRG